MTDSGALPTVDGSATRPLFIGCVITWFLSGSLLVQTYDYFCTDPLEGDVVFIKLAVWGAFIVDHLRSIAVTAGAWEGLVAAWGNSSNFFEISVLSAMTVPLTGLESGLVQIFFAWRIWRLKRDSKLARFLAMIISLVALLQFSASIARGVTCYKYENTHRGVYSVDTSAKVWLFGTLVCDCIIVLTMTFLLKQAKLKCSFNSTKRILVRLIIVTLETGAITLVATLVQIIFYLKYPNNVHQQVSILYILGGLYSNVLLAVLNGRKRVRRQLTEPSQNTLSIHFSEQGVLPHHPSALSSASCPEELGSNESQMGRKFPILDLVGADELV